MLGRLRLAERRGLLLGANASRVQTLGLEILMFSDDMAEASRQVKSMISMVPSLDGPAVEEGVTEENVYDDGPDIVWKMPEMDRDDMLDVIRSMGQGGTMTAADLE